MTRPALPAALLVVVAEDERSESPPDEHAAADLSTSAACPPRPVSDAQVLPLARTVVGRAVECRSSARAVHCLGMARIDIPDGPGGDSAMVWTLRPEMSGMVHKMITTTYGSSNLPAAEREVARMRIAQLNACGACATFRAQSVVEAGVSEEMYLHLDEWRTFPGYTDRQRLAIEYAEQFAVDHRAIDDELFGRLRNHFADDEILDLTLCLAVYLGLGRTLEVLQITEHADVDL